MCSVDLSGYIWVWVMGTVANLQLTVQEHVLFISFCLCLYFVNSFAFRLEPRFAVTVALEHQCVPRELSPWSATSLVSGEDLKHDSLGIDSCLMALATSLPLAVDQMKLF